MDFFERTDWMLTYFFGFYFDFNIKFLKNTPELQILEPSKKNLSEDQKKSSL